MQSDSELKAFETRNHNLDLLRILAMIAVVVIHAAAPYVLRSTSHNSDFATAITYDAFSRFCVPVFVMISGALMFSFNKKIDQDPWQYYMKKVKRFFPPIAFWIVFYLGFNGKLPIFDIKSLADVGNVIWGIVLAGVPHYHLWYVFMLPGLFFIAPLLMHLKNKVTPKQWAIIGVVLLLFGIAHKIWRQTMSPAIWVFAEFIDFVGYLIIGDVLLNKKASRPLLFFGYVVGSISIAAAVYYFTLAYPGNYYFNSFLSPLVVISSLNLFALINQGISFAKSKFLYDVALSSFGIYLVHGAIIDTLIRATNYSLTSMVAMDIFLYTVITLTIAYIIVKILRNVRVFKWIVGL